LREKNSTEFLHSETQRNIRIFGLKNHNLTMNNKFFSSGKGSKRKRLQKLRQQTRPRKNSEQEEQEGGQQSVSSLPPSEGEIVFKTALQQHEIALVLGDVAPTLDNNDHLDDYDNHNDDDDDQVDNEDEDEDQDQDQDPQDKDDSKEERFAKFRKIVAPFENHMGSREGGEKAVDDVKLAAKRFWELLEGTYFRKNQSYLEPTEVAVHAWILSLVEKEFTNISKYLDDVALRRGLRPNTIKAYLTSSYIPFFIWYRLFSLVAPQPSPDAYARLQVILKSLVANYRKLAKVTKRVETKTVEELIATKQWPPGGLPELQAAYLRNLPSILCAFDEGVETYRHNEEFHRSFMEQMMFGKIFSHLTIIVVL